MATPPTPPLPSFERPPVVEVSLSVQFQKISKLTPIHLGQLWASWKSRFPRLEFHSPLDPSFERFGVPDGNQPSIRFEMFNAPPFPRCWFLNSTGTELIQLQQDRFVRNWRKSTGNEVYKRYNTIRENLVEDYTQFVDFLNAEGMETPIPNQCEIAYVNHIKSDGVWQSHGDLHRVFTVWNSQYSDDFLKDPEDVRFQTRHQIRNEEGKPIGRLHIAVEPMRSRTDKTSPMLLMKLVARGEPLGANLDGILRFMDTGREWIVRAFASVTTREMHTAWGRER